MSRNAWFRSISFLVVLVMIFSMMGCSHFQDKDVTNVAEETPTNKTAIKQDPIILNSIQENYKGLYQNLVINDFLVGDNEYLLETKDNFTFIMLSKEIITYPFKQLYTTNSYPELSTENGQITMVWMDQENKVTLKIDMVEGSKEAYINDSNEPLDIGVAPKTVDGTLYIPINLFVSLLKMKETHDYDLNITFIHYEENFPQKILSGCWSDSNTNIFTDFENAVKGEQTLPLYATGYQFFEDGTYQLMIIGGNNFADSLIYCKGKYKILGNTLVYFDITETAYEGNPFKLIYENKKLDCPQFDFIENMDPDRNQIKITGFWLSRINP